MLPAAAINKDARALPPQSSRKLLDAEFTQTHIHFLRFVVNQVLTGPKHSPLFHRSLVAERERRSLRRSGAAAPETLAFKPGENSLETLIFET